jgi:Protein of unknown function (DUF1499)
MANIPYLYLVVAVVVIALLIFVRIIRRIVGLVVRIAIALGATAVAIFAIAVLVNNETIYEQPGIEARTIRFVTVNYAATSAKGLGTANCKWPDEAAATPSAAPSPAEARAARPARREKRAEPAPAASPTATPAPPDVYPELMTRGFPGIPRTQLFDLSQQVVNSLGGWKIIKADRRAGTLDCLYTTRIFGFEDDVRITVTPRSEIELCSRSGTARPASGSLLRFFPGDFGANIGHIKQFYETLEPKMDEVYKEEQEKENGNKPRAPMR